MDLTFRPLTAEQWPALEDLFGRAGASNGCWCMYWRIGPRYKDRPREDNKHDLERLAGSGRPPGLLAFDGGAAVGWCEVAPRADLDWLARSRSLPPVDELPVWSVPCFYVRRTHRGGLPEADWVPNDSFRQMTACRRARSAALLVGSTPATSRNVHRCSRRSHNSLQNP